MSMEQIYERINGRSAAQIVQNCLQNYLHTTEARYDVLLDQFNASPYNRISHPVSYFEESATDILEHWDDYLWLHGILADEASRETLEHMLTAKLTMDTSCIEKAFSREKIYFSPDIWGELGQEVYLDCGAYDGDSILQFIRACPWYKKILAVEAVPEIMLSCKKNLEDIPNGNIHYFEIAAGERRETLRFDMGTLQGESCVSNSGNSTVMAEPLDELPHSDITFIKMDIEGSESAAIAGAKKLIERNSPKMAICIYHKPGDFWQIPKEILAINPSYSFKIRQHHYEVFSETVLYCIPSTPGPVTPPDKTSSDAYGRLLAVSKKLPCYTRQENDNLLQHGLDKKWFLEQLLNLTRENTALHAHTQDLLEAKNWLEGQNRGLTQRAEELQSWCRQLEEGKQWLEEQNRELTQRAEKLQSWSDQQAETHRWLQEQLQNVQTENAALTQNREELQHWCRQLEEGKQWLEEQNTALNQDVLELRRWSAEQDAAKEWLNVQLQIGQKENDQLNRELWQLQKEIADVKNKLARTTYERNRLENDYMAVPAFIRKMTKKH